MKEITIITYFLNEGEEVWNTLLDLQLHTDVGSCDVIVINDASNDGVDYDAIVRQFPHVRYYRNSRRKGVAACRDMGVELCRTPYFIMVDCHVRFIGHTWLDEVIAALKEEPEALLCCQTRFLRKRAGRLEVEYVPACGARIDFDDPLLRCRWREPTAADQAAGHRVPIPCVLGSGYAASRAYWQRLGGLAGLRSYGLDEQYISLKVWLSGGRCLLLRHTPLAHIYRCDSQVPYQSPSPDYHFNILLIIETLFPETQREEARTRLRLYNETMYWHIVALMARESALIDRLRAQYDAMRTRDFGEIMVMHRPSEA